MDFPENLTMDSLFLWLMHRIAVVFGEKAILKGGMELRLFDLPRFTNDLDYIFSPYNSKKEITKELEGILNEIPDGKIKKSIHSKILRFQIQVKDIAVQLEASVAEKCPSIVMSTAALSGQVNQIARVIRVMRLDVALAHKLAAWNERRLVRDLYDIYSLYTVLGEKPDRHTLINRLSHFNSRLPALRSIKQMSIEDFSSQLLQEANSLTAERLQPLHALLEEMACIGLEHKIRISLYDIVVFLQQW